MQNEITNEEFTPDTTPLGNSTEALLENGEEKRYEKAMEILNEYMHSMATGEDIEPIIIARQNGKLFVERCEKDEAGNLTLPQIETLTHADLRRKNKLVKRIVQKIAPRLLADIENVTFIALMRKDENKLVQALKSINKCAPEKIRIENRLGCIWVVVGNYEFVL